MTKKKTAAIGATGCAVAWADHLIAALPQHDLVDRPGIVACDVIVLHHFLSPLLNGLIADYARRLHDYRDASKSALALLRSLRAGDGITDDAIADRIRLLDRALAHDVAPQ